MLLWPQPTLSRYSSPVYCASWITRFAPRRKVMWRSSPGCWDTRPEAFQNGSWSVAYTTVAPSPVMRYATVGAV